MHVDDRTRGRRDCGGGWRHDDDNNGGRRRRATTVVKIDDGEGKGGDLVICVGCRQENEESGVASGAVAVVLACRRKR